MSLSISGWRLLLDTWNPHITLTFILIHICLLKAVMISLQVGVLWGRKTVFNACTYKYSNQCCFSATWLLLVMPRFESNGMDGLSACHSFQVAPRFYVYNVLRNFISQVVSMQNTWVNPFGSSNLGTERYHTSKAQQRCLQCAAIDLLCSLLK